MALEGRIRDLGLIEVIQLLAVGRKTGTLHCHAPLQGRRAQISVESGLIVHAEATGVDRLHELHAPRRRATDAKGIEDAVHDVLLWRDGTFRFAPGERPAHDSTVRMAVEPLLMEAAHRAEVWQRVHARVPHARVIPAFVDVSPQQLPLLRLTPPQWEILTYVDGQRDLVALAAAMQRDVTAVAELVYELIGSGLLSLREGESAPRRNPTPPATPAVTAPARVASVVPAPVVPAPAVPRGHDLWVPSGSHMAVAPAHGDHDEDSLFDPVELGVLTADGFPRYRTPWPAPASVASPPVASPAVEPSVQKEQEQATVPVSAPGQDGPALCQHGDDLARAGDLVGAMAYWNAALRAAVPVANAERVREAVALASRLHALLHP